MDTECSGGTPPPDYLHVVRVTCKGAEGRELESVMAEMLPDGVSWHDAESDVVRFEAYFAAREEAERRLDDILPMLRPRVGGSAKAEVCVLKNENWAEAWKASFTVERVSPRVVIKPTWESCEPREGDCIIEIDPGLSFGTGQHPTTRACLTFIDDLSREGFAGSLLDVGCGSGILAIAAAKLGFCPVEAIDSDPVAVDTTRNNCELNGVMNAIDCRQAALGRGDLPRAFDVVVANVYARVLSELSEALVRLVAPGPGSRLLLAGVLTRQYDGLAAVYLRLGFREERRLSCGGWTSGRFARLPVSRHS